MYSIFEFVYVSRLRSFLSKIIETLPLIKLFSEPKIVKYDGNETEKFCDYSNRKMRNMNRKHYLKIRSNLFYRKFEITISWILLKFNIVLTHEISSPKIKFLREIKRYNLKLQRNSNKHFNFKN